MENVDADGETVKAVKFGLSFSLCMLLNIVLKSKVTQDDCKNPLIGNEMHVRLRETDHRSFFFLGFLDFFLRLEV